MFVLEVVAFICVGLVAGFISGLMGISGGVVIVPCLTLAFYLIHIPVEFRMHVVIGTALATMVFGTFASSHTHRKHGRVLFPIVKPMIVGIIVGTVTGSGIAKFLPGQVLRILFGMTELAVGIRFILPVKEATRHTSLPSKGMLMLIATGVATISTVLGIGLLYVPILIYSGVPTKKAIGTASMLGFITVVSATCFLFVTGRGTVSYPLTSGWIYVPAFLAVGIGLVCMAPVGAKVTTHLPTAVLHRVFGSVLLIAGLILIFGRS
ncbi:MAG: sulfite exporter TauE/SafE family protein [Simkaniaceae bacterium]|nr:sulfite exporter TauE/SafE family protein [Simkaniaceae bacterium]